MKWSMTSSVEEWGPQVADQLHNIWSAGQAMLYSAEQRHNNLAGLPTNAHTVWIQVNAKTITPVVVPGKAATSLPQQPTATALSASRAMQPEPVFRQELHRAAGRDASPADGAANARHPCAGRSA